MLTFPDVFNDADIGIGSMDVPMTQGDSLREASDENTANNTNGASGAST
jgi:hypothetical protein